MVKCEYITCKISFDKDTPSRCSAVSVGVDDDSGSEAGAGLGFAANWSLLRSFFEDPFNGVAITLHDTAANSSSTTVGLATPSLRSTHSNNSLWRFQHATSTTTTSVSLSVGRGSDRDTDTINDILQQVRLAADIGKNILRLKKRAKILADKSWQHYERRLYNELGSTDATTPLMSISSTCAAKHYVLTELIYQKLQQATTMDWKKIRGDVRTNKLCSSDVLLKWIEQQRHSMQQQTNSKATTPVLLDFNYRGSDAADDQSIVLLDSSIDVNRHGVFLHDHEAEDARRAGAHVMVSAIRTAAELQLPINMTAIMPLTPATQKPTSTCILPTIPNYTDSMIVINLKYEPQSVCDLESFGIQASIELLFNLQFPIWRHFHLNRDRVDGTLEPMWMLVSKEQNSCFDDLLTKSVVHADCSEDSMQDLLNLSKHNIVPHMLWRNRDNRPYRTMVRFFHEISITKCSFSCSALEQRCTL